jgi:hypothetical protein
MKKNLSIFGLLAAITLTFNVSSASADPTYALLDANGNVTNIIVCGSACAGGEWAGQRAVPQVAAGPNGENRGGFWSGPGTTTYDSNSGTFTWNKPEETKQVIETEANGSVSTSTVVISPGAKTEFKYSDTVGSNLLTRSGFVVSYNDSSSSTLSVTNSGPSYLSSESISFQERKTEQEITQSINAANLTLINSKINILIELLGSWVK